MTRPALLVLCGLCACQPKPETGGGEEPIPVESRGMVIASEAFAPGAEIPREYTCEGADRSPPLRWSNVPVGTRSLALVVTDPDAPDPADPKTTWTHWLLVDLPAGDGSLPAGVAPDKLPEGTHAGMNDFKTTSYGGPCPPIGRHRYFFTLYALDTSFAGLSEPTRAELDEAMEGHVLAQTELMGTYQKQGNKPQS